jgi:hypothetical protein
VTADEEERKGPDLSDPDVRDMVARNHMPEESWNNAGGFNGVTCTECHQDWPCPTIQELRHRGPSVR